MATEEIKVIVRTDCRITLPLAIMREKGIKPGDAIGVIVRKLR